MQQPYDLANHQNGGRKRSLGGIGIGAPPLPIGQSQRRTPLANASGCETVIAGGA